MKSSLDKYKKDLEGKKVLVTGGTGMIGREIVDKLCKQDCIVTSVSLDDLNLNNKAKYIKGDLSDLNFCLDITNRIDYVFHVAGIKGSIVKTKTMPSSFFVPLISRLISLFDNFGAFNLVHGSFNAGPNCSNICFIPDFPPAK